jgi:hypothetical protein
MRWSFVCLKLVGIVLVPGSLFGQGFEPLEPGGAKQAWSVLPARFQDGVVKLSADGGDPQPGTWYFLAKNADKDGQIFSITVTNGEVTQTKPSLDLRALVKNPSVMKWENLVLDSGQVFEKASEWMDSKGKTLGTVSYVLNQKGSGASPIWSLWCYGPDGSYFGEIQFMADTGTVVSTNVD